MPLSLPSFPADATTVITTDTSLYLLVLLATMLLGIGEVLYDNSAQTFMPSIVHPDNLEKDSLGSGMGWPFVMGVVTALAAYFHLLRLRVDLERRRAEQLAHLDEFDR